MTRYQIYEETTAEPAQRWQVILLPSTHSADPFAVISRHPDMNTATLAANRLNEQEIA